MAVPLCLAISTATATDLFYWCISIHLNRQAELFKTLCLHFCLCCHDNLVNQVCPTQSATLRGKKRVWKASLHCFVFSLFYL